MQEEETPPDITRINLIVQYFIESLPEDEWRILAAALITKARIIALEPGVSLKAALHDALEQIADVARVILQVSNKQPPVNPFDNNDIFRLMRDLAEKGVQIAIEATPFGSECSFSLSTPDGPIGETDDPVGLLYDWADEKGYLG